MIDFDMLWGLYVLFFAVYTIELFKRIKKQMDKKENYKTVAVRPKEIEKVVYLDEINLANDFSFYVVKVNHPYNSLPFMLLRWYGKGRSLNDYNLVWEWLLVPHMFATDKSQVFTKNADAIKYMMDKGCDVMQFKNEKEFEKYLIEYCKKL